MWIVNWNHRLFSHAVNWKEATINVVTWTISWPFSLIECRRVFGISTVNHAFKPLFPKWTSAVSSNVNKTEDWRLLNRLFSCKLSELNDSFEENTQRTHGTSQALTVVRELRLHLRHVQDEERCDGGVYSCFNDPTVQSHSFSRPSGDKSAKIRPLLSKAHRVPSIFHGSICTWDQSCWIPILALAKADNEQR